MSQPNSGKHLEEDISVHIFTVSSAMVGVCLTVIGLIRVVVTLGKADTVADDLLAGDAFLFLLSSLLSYSALRTRSKRRMHRRGADCGRHIHSRHDFNGRHLRIYYLRDRSSRKIAMPGLTRQWSLIASRHTIQRPMSSTGQSAAGPVLVCGSSCCSS
jgi:hypothetical protein